ncbi:MAG: hypothetical protein WBX25_35565 [Rhodomicrobium sp.]
MIATGKQLAGARILVVEDDAVVAFDIISLLKEGGAQTVGPARTVGEAVELAKAEPVNCGILDVGLRDGPVLPATTILREKGAAIIFHTGLSAIEELKQDWPDAHILLKPVQLKKMVQTIVTACCPARLQETTPSAQSSHVSKAEAKEPQRPLAVFECSKPERPTRDC